MGKWGYDRSSMLVVEAGNETRFRKSKPALKNKIFSSITFILLYLVFNIVSFAQAIETPSAETIISKIKANQSLISDMQADTKTVITSNIAMPGTVSKGPQTLVQTGHIWTKGQDKSRVEITSPNKQTTITNGTIMTIIMPETGKRVTQDLSKMKQGMDAAKALDYFNLTVIEAGTKEYIISGKPKEANQFLGKMDFFIDGTKNVPVRIAMYTSKGALMSLTELDYQPVEVSSSETAYVPLKIKSVVTSSMGSVNSEMEYTNIKVNQGLKDELFDAN